MNDVMNITPKKVCFSWEKYKE